MPKKKIQQDLCKHLDTRSGRRFRFSETCRPFKAAVPNLSGWWFRACVCHLHKFSFTCSHAHPPPARPGSQHTLAQHRAVAWGLATSDLRVGAICISRRKLFQNRWIAIEKNTFAFIREKRHTSLICNMTFNWRDQSMHTLCNHTGWAETIGGRCYFE